MAFHIKPDAPMHFEVCDIPDCDLPPLFEVNEAITIIPEGPPPPPVKICPMHIAEVLGASLMPPNDDKTLTVRVATVATA